MNKLDFELVPDACWYSNLRSILSKKQWDFLRKDAYERADGKCMICGRKSKRLEAHEKWSYDIDNGVQKLEDIVAICHDCHSVIHIGRTSLVGNIVRAQNHYMKVNCCTYADYIQNLSKANQLHLERNKVVEWKLDLTYLKKYTK